MVFIHLCLSLFFYKLFLHFSAFPAYFLFCLHFFPPFIFSSLSFCHSPDVLPVCFSPTDSTFSACVPVFGYTIYTDTNLKQYHTHCPVCVWLVYLCMGTPADDEKRCKICIFAFLFQFLYLFLHHVSHLHFCLSACVCVCVSGLHCLADINKIRENPNRKCLQAPG